MTRPGLKSRSTRWSARPRSRLPARAPPTQTGRFRAGRVQHLTSRDPVGAPIFYRDVPLMPSELKKGVIKPLAPAAVPLIAWRLRDVGEPQSRLLLEGLHTCANCHSFSARRQDAGHGPRWPAERQGHCTPSCRSHRELPSAPRTSSPGTPSRTSPRRRPRRLHVAVLARRPVRGHHGQRRRKKLRTTTTSANFKDYRFLQVFYPTRGILAWYNRATRRMAAPAGRRRSALRANGRGLESRRQIPGLRPRRGAGPLSRRAGSSRNCANDPNETQIQYDLYRIPFNGGQGGNAGTDRRRFAQRHEQHLPQGVARWPVDRLRPVPQRPAHAPRQPALHRPARAAARRAACAATRR